VQNSDSEFIAGDWYQILWSFSQIIAEPGADLRWLSARKTDTHNYDPISSLYSVL